MNDLPKLMNKLGLLGMKESMECRLSEAIASNITYQDFLTIALEDEAIYRDNRRSNTLKKRASFREIVSLEGFESSNSRGVNRSMIKQLSSLSFIRESENIIFVGGTGAGKSYLAQAIGLNACMSGHETLFYSTELLFRNIEAAEKSGTFLTFLKKLSKSKLLILDDFGLRNYSHCEAISLIQILDDRYKRASIIVTSQTKPDGWKSLFEDPIIAEAIIDRLKGSAHVIELKGKTYRPNHIPKQQIKVDEKQ